MVVAKIYTHARQMPEKTAVIDFDHRLSYREFAYAISATRRYFSTRLSDGGVAVLAITSRLDSWLVALALRSLGVTTVGVPSAEHLGQLGLPDIRCVVTLEIEHWPGVEALCSAAGWRLVSLPPTIYADISAPGPSEIPDLAEHEGAHIVLTSGTTGVYKKVLIDPACRAIQAAARRNIFEISSQSVVNVCNHGCWTGTGYHYPSITWDLGGTVIFRPVDLWESFPRGGVTHAYGTPSSMAQILSAPGNGSRRDDGVRLFLTGGPPSRSMADEIRATVTRQLYTYIGTTEIGILTLTPIEQAEDLRSHRILPSREVQIVDAQDRILPADREGLLRVRIIDGVKGYLYDDEASRAFFRDGFFYTGDLGVIRADGRLVLVGRVTDVINVLGTKHAPGPVEEAVQREFGLSGACIFSIKQADGEEALHIVIESRQLVDLHRLGVVLGSMLPGPVRFAVHLVVPFRGTTWARSSAIY